MLWLQDTQIEEGKHTGAIPLLLIQEAGRAVVQVKNQRVGKHEFGCLGGRKDEHTCIWTYPFEILIIPKE